MSVHIKFKCDGCEAESGTTRMQRRFVGINGRSWGFGKYETDTLEDLAPEGWVAFDPYTSCTYCKDCWDAIMNDDDPIVGQA